MLRNIEDRVNKEVKFNLRNFGADIIYVIHDPKRTQRRIDFEHAWGHFTGFDYEFIDAVTPNDFDMNEAIETKLGDSFYDIGDVCLTKEIISIALSHFKAYDKSKSSTHSRFLILEDDARPTEELMKSIYSGEFKKFIKGIKKRTFEWIFLGTADRIIKGTDYNKFLKKPENFTGLAAHAVLYSKDAINNIVDNYNKIEFAADLFLHYLNDSNIFPNVYSTYTSWISQVNYAKFLPPDHPDFEYSCGSQVDPTSDKSSEEYPTISKDMLRYLERPFKTKGRYLKVNWKTVPSLL